MQEKLLVLRKKAGLSQKEVADMLSISVTSYGEKERGAKAFTMDEMFLIANFFQKPLEEIFLPRKSPKKET